MSIVELVEHTKTVFRFLASKWAIILTFGFVSGIGGFVYAWIEKPNYIAEITFAPEVGKSNSLGLGMYSGLAAQFGLDLGGGGGVFEGENLSELLKSKMMVEKTLFTSATINDKQQTLIEYYANANDLYNKWKEDSRLSTVDFKKTQAGLRARDSIVNVIVFEIRQSLTIEKIDKKLIIFSAKLKTGDEIFTKVFLEQLTANGIQYYLDYRSQKSRENVSILQRQLDSVRNVLLKNIVSVAAASDLNVNPLRQLPRANSQHKQIDIQANGQLYAELLKQLELARIALRKETPLIQVIDSPKLPLEKEKLGKLMGAALFAAAGGVLCCLFLLSKRWYKFHFKQKTIVA